MPIHLTQLLYSLPDFSARQMTQSDVELVPRAMGTDDMAKLDNLLSHRQRRKQSRPLYRLCRGRHRDEARIHAPIPVIRFAWHSKTRHAAKIVQGQC
jgi:hypothetical protein